MELKLNPETAREWNKSLGKSKEFAYKQIHDFLMIWTRRYPNTTKASDAVDAKARVRTCPSVNIVSVPTCANCAGSHHLAACEDFLSKPIAQRSALVKKKQVCFNCLRSGDFRSKCQSRSRCTHCHRKHHSLLHSAVATAPMPVDQALEVDDSSQTLSTAPSPTVANVQNAQAQVAPVQVLLATAWVELYTTEGRRFKVRTLFDQGSTLSFISESLCQTLRTKRQGADLQIRCFGDNYTGLARSKVSLRLGPCAKPGFTFPFTAYVFQRITTYAASQMRLPYSWPHLRDLELADPNPASRQPIHLLIGADLYGLLQAIFAKVH